MRLRLLRAAYSRKRRPTSVEPVKDTTSTPGCSPSASPTEEPGPVITLNTPSGMPASAANSASFRVESEVTLAGLRMTLLPSARAGPSFQPTIMSGKFHGRTQATTPAGSRTMSPSLPSPEGEMPPYCLSAHSACHSRHSMVSGRSVSRHSRTGFPLSSDSRTASST